MFLVTPGPSSESMRSYRFTVPQGFVWAIVHATGDGIARIDVSEEQAALSAEHEPNSLSDTTRALMDRARNRFGTRAMLGMMRYVVSQHPEVHTWDVDRITGANPHGSRRAVRV